MFGSVLERPSARDVDLGVWFEEYSFERYLRALELAEQVLGTGRQGPVVAERAGRAGRRESRFQRSRSARTW